MNEGELLFLSEGFESLDMYVTVIDGEAITDRVRLFSHTKLPTQLWVKGIPNTIVYPVFISMVTLGDDGIPDDDTLGRAYDCWIRLYEAEC